MTKRKTRVGHLDYRELSPRQRQGMRGGGPKRPPPVSVPSDFLYPEPDPGPELKAEDVMVGARLGKSPDPEERLQDAREETDYWKDVLSTWKERYRTAQSAEEKRDAAAKVLMARVHLDDARAEKKIWHRERRAKKGRGRRTGRS